MPRRGLKINTRGLSTKVDSFNPRLRRGITAIFDYQGARSTGRMKTRAPWTDRTTNARSSLAAIPSHTQNTWKLTLTHGVAYGIYLETRFSGRYAVVIPEVPRAGEDIMRLINKLIDTM